MVYPLEYQPNNVIQGNRKHIYSVPSSFQRVLIRYEKILAIKAWGKICDFGEHEIGIRALFRGMSVMV